MQDVGWGVKKVGWRIKGEDDNNDNERWRIKDGGWKEDEIVDVERRMKETMKDDDNDNNAYDYDK